MATHLVLAYKKGRELQVDFGGERVSVESSVPGLGRYGVNYRGAVRGFYPGGSITVKEVDGRLYIPGVRGLEEALARNSAPPKVPQPPTAAPADLDGRVGAGSGADYTGEADADKPPSSDYKPPETFEVGKAYTLKGYCFQPDSGTLAVHLPDGRKLILDVPVKDRGNYTGYGGAVLVRNVRKKGRHVSVVPHAPERVSSNPGPGEDLTAPLEVLVVTGDGDSIQLTIPRTHKVLKQEYAPGLKLACSYAGKNGIGFEGDLEVVRTISGLLQKVRGYKLIPAQRDADRWKQTLGSVLRNDRRIVVCAERTRDPHRPPGWGSQW